jgi:hypothetical protein
MRRRALFAFAVSVAGGIVLILLLTTSSGGAQDTEAETGVTRIEKTIRFARPWKGSCGFGTCDIPVLFEIPLDPV